MISDFDLLIGATAVANDLIVVTENTKEFQRISQLKFCSVLSDQKRSSRISVICGKLLQ
jgi:predicted nucleic acid-binding protein